MKTLLILIIIGLILVVAAVWMRERKRRIRIESTDNIVEEIRKIGELTTARYYEELLIKTSRDASGEIVFTEDRTPHLTKSYLIKSVKGTVRAGFNLKEAEEGDIKVEDNVLTLKLPHALILETIVRQQDIETLVEKGKWLHEQSVDVMQKAYDTLRENALENGILASAERSARANLLHICKILGFRDVKIEFK